MKNAIELFSSTPFLLKIGGGEIKKIYVGNKDVSSMYIGNTLIYSLGDTPNIPTEQPIMDGLVYWMDALSLNHGDNMWNNKVGSGAFTFNDFTYDDTSEGGILFSSEKQTLLTSDFTINKGVYEPLSIELFLEITSIGSNNDWVMSIDDWQNGFLLGILGDVYALSGSRTAVLNTGVKVVTNEKTQLCIVFNTDKTYSFYINGKFISSRTTYTDFSINSKNIVLGGSSPEYPQDCMDGYIYSFRLYNRILTAEEVMENYEYELPPKEEPSIVSDGLICWLDAWDSLNKDRVNNDVVYKGISGNLGYFTNENVSGSNIAISTPPFTTSDLTIEFGIKRKDEAHWGRICGFYESDGTEDKKTVITFFNDNSYNNSVSVLNQLRYYTFVDASKKKCISKTPITPSDEYNIITIDFKNKKVYVNGVEDTHDDFSNLIYPSQEFTKVSLFNDLTTSNTNGMKADIGFFRMYNRALTSEEMRRNYEYESTVIRGSLPPSTEEESTPLITDGLICWLDARGLSDFTQGKTWRDLSGNENNGLITQISLTSLENGILDGSGYINIPNPTKGLSNYTVEVGFKDLDTGYWLGLWGNTSGSTGNNIYKQNGGYSGYPTPMYVGISKTEREYHTVVVKDNQASVYFNGSLLGENLCTLTPSDADYFVFMGRKPNNPTQGTNGGADAKRAEWYFLRIYDRALTGDEISSNYVYETEVSRGTSNVEEAEPIVPPITSEPIMDGLICWLDGGDLTSGDTVWNDRTNNQNNFQLYNTSSFSYTGKGLKNNSNGYATLSKVITFNEYTIEIKHRRHSWQTDSLLFNAKRSGKNYDIILGYAYSNAYQCYSNSSPSHYEISRDNVALNKDITLTWVVRASERKLYMDGVYYASATNSSGHESVDIASIDLFKYNNVCCNATIYSIKIYNRALSEDEIQKNAEYEDTIDRS